MESVIDCAKNADIEKWIHKHKKLAPYGETQIPEYIAAVEKLVRAIRTYGVKDGEDFHTLKSLYKSDYHRLTTMFSHRGQMLQYVDQFGMGKYERLEEFRLFLVIGAQLYHTCDMSYKQKEILKTLRKLKENPHDTEIETELQKFKEDLDLPADLDVGKLVTQSQEKKYEDMDKLILDCKKLIDEANQAFIDARPKLSLHEMFPMVFFGELRNSMLQK